MTVGDGQEDPRVPQDSRVPQDKRQAEVGGGDVCTAQHAWSLTTPLRRLITNPSVILRGLVHDGDTALDLGCGPGFFTLPLARMVGDRGKVVAIDLQAEMLERLKSRAERSGLLARIQLRQCGAETIGEVEPADFALAFYMVHEVPDVGHFMGEVGGALKPEGRFLLIEPKGRVSAEAFEKTVHLARQNHLTELSRPRVGMSRAALFVRE
jgi:ubiquinone/menaquinone biosynthesis C-methylase UbiE